MLLSQGYCSYQQDGLWYLSLQRVEQSFFLVQYNIFIFHTHQELTAVLRKFSRLDLDRQGFRVLLELLELITFDKFAALKNPQRRKKHVKVKCLSQEHSNVVSDNIASIYSAA